MEIGLLSWAYPPTKSGLSRAAREIAQSLAAAGHGVRVLTLDRTERTWDDAVEVIGCAPRPGSRLDRMRGIPGLGHLGGPLAFKRAARAEHRRRPFDVIEATNWYAPGLAIALSGPAPLVTRASTPVATSSRPPASLRDRIDLAVARGAERLAARRSAGMISNTAAHGMKIATLYGVAPPGPAHAVIGLSLPPAIVARGRAAAYPATATPVELLFVGRAERRKGYDALFAALPMLAAEAEARTLPDFRLTMIGLAEREVDALPAPAAARLRLFHRVEEERLHDHLAAAHIVVAPSRYESFGLVYQEAMMFGRPILACAEDPSARLFVGETGAGLLASRCDGPAIAATLRRLIADPTLRDRLRRTSRAAAGRFTRETLAQETLAAYRAAIGRPS